MNINVMHAMDFREIFELLLPLYMYWKNSRSWKATIVEITLYTNPENLKICFKKCTGFYTMEALYVLDLHKFIRMYASYKYFLEIQKAGVASKF